MQEQQLRARQLVLQQQAASAVAAASKTQREVGAAAVRWVLVALHGSFMLLRSAQCSQACELTLTICCSHPCPAH